VRRFVAFWIDFMFAMMVVGPILGILPVLTEWRRTGEFAWNFERTIYAEGDGVMAAMSVALAGAALFCYFTLPLVRNKPTPGSCIMGYQVASEGSAPLSFWKAFARCVLGFAAMSGWFLAFFIARDRKNGKFWLDKVFGTRAVKIV
jgi:uncharacterized RDD family membrane protein YckC